MRNASASLGQTSLEAVLDGPFYESPSTFTQLYGPAVGAVLTPPTSSFVPTGWISDFASKPTPKSVAPDSALPNSRVALLNTNKALPNTNGALPNTNGALPNTNGALPNYNGWVPGFRAGGVYHSSAGMNDDSYPLYPGY